MGTHLLKGVEGPQLLVQVSAFGPVHKALHVLRLLHQLDLLPTSHWLHPDTVAKHVMRIGSRSGHCRKLACLNPLLHAKLHCFSLSNRGALMCWMRPCDPSTICTQKWASCPASALRHVQVAVPGLEDRARALPPPASTTISPGVCRPRPKMSHRSFQHAADTQTTGVLI